MDKPRDIDGNQVALREYLERLIDHEAKLNAQRFAALYEAIKKASEAMNIRLESMNEFRHQIEAQEKRYAERSKVEALAEKTDFRLSKLERSESIMTGKTAMVWAMFVVGAAIVGAVISLFTK